MPDFTAAARTIASQCPCLRVRQASRALTRLYDEELRPAGIQMSQLSILVAVAMFGPEGAGMAAIADVLSMDRTTLSRNLKVVERARLVRTARDPADGRARLVFLTKMGQRALEAAFPLWERAQQQAQEALGKPRVDALHAELGQAVARLQRRP
jgi:DNA-binding MarR family transcriptional regulator